MHPALRPVRSLVALYAGCGYTIIVLFTLLAGLKVKPHWCAIAGATSAVTGESVLRGKGLYRSRCENRRTANASAIVIYSPA